MSRGILTVVSGFSGAGKGTLMKRLMEEYDNYALSISVTTRDPRPGEEDGVSTFSVQKKSLTALVEEDAFLEYARYGKTFLRNAEGIRRGAAGCRKRCSA